MKKILKATLSLGFAGAIAVSAASCNGNTVESSVTNNSAAESSAEAKKDYTFRTSTTVSPSNWNELTYQDNNDTQIMSYISGAFFTYDYVLDANGEIEEGNFKVQYDGATNIKDVTTDYAGDAKYAVPANATEAYAYQITLRNDLKWDDGTPIKAQDFVYSMKQQLDPLFMNYRADSFYNGATVLNDAENYVKQGSYNYSAMVSADYGADEYVAVEDFTTTADGTLQYNGKDVVLNVNSGGNWGSSSLKKYYTAYGASMFGTGFQSILDKAGEDGNVKLTKADYDILCDMIAVLHGKANAEAYAATAGEYAYKEIQEMLFYGYVFEEVDFDEVGIFAKDDYNLVVVLDKQLQLLDDGELTYKCAYNFSSLPLVKQDKFEANKKAPDGASTLWTSTYNSNVESTASWGPYKLTEFQSGKFYKLEKNEYWYGYNMDEYKGQYQTTAITCDTIEKYETQLLKFLAGELDEIGIDVSVATDYKNSEQAVYTPSSYVGSLQLQSNKEALKARETEGVNKTILAQEDFRKALSLSIDRADYANKCTTSSLAGYGIFNSMHYYDVAHGGAYRNTDAAKKTLCDVYGVEYTDANLNSQYRKITGYNPDLAKTLFDSAYDKALAAGDIKATDKVVLTYGTSADNESVRRNFDYFSEVFKNAVKGTKLEGKLELAFDASFGTKWADDFRDGAYDLCQGGWSGAAWDPGYFLLAYLSPDYMYSKAWDTSAATLEFTMPGKYLGEGKEDVTATKTLLEWYDLLNGAWGAGLIADEGRCLLIAALEKEILSVYYTVPLVNSFSASMISFKVEYASRDYNTFLGYGGYRYLTYNFDDEAWTEHAKAGLNYKG